MANFRTWGVFLISLILFIAPLQALAETVIVDTPSLKVRSGPGLSYDVIGSVKQGDQFEILTSQDDWSQIDYKGHKGWIASWLTKSNSAQSINRSAIVQVKNLNVRSSASTSSSLVGQLQQGTMVQVLSIDGSWAEISFKGTTAWVHTDYIQLVTGSTSEQTPKTKPSSFVVQIDALNVRKKPTLDSKRVGVVYRNEVLKVVSISSNWVEVELLNGAKGWVYSYYGVFQDNPATSAPPTSAAASTTVTILYNGTNLRTQPSTSGEVAARVDAGLKLKVVSSVNDWYEVDYKGQKAFVANWVVTTDDVAIDTSSPKTEEKVDRKKGTLNGLDIVIDPGHGGNDRGTTGYYGTDEKGLTLPTAELLASKLEAAGARVTLTRDSDTYVSLRKRVSVSHQVGADAFISVHYDSVDDSSVHGFTTYYQHGFQKELADQIHGALQDRLSLRDRGVRQGNYLVLRENKQHAVLLELGYLSNATEERTVTTAQFRENAAHAIYEGIINFFDAQLK
ncbi:SH3 domain-containing protein [Chryseomicrobium palamuruense]|uniref:SH3 domain-containing protein n=1 Tax=Chryseomicrobium palamuruense TaxID=682973 RepID=A0ABV8UXI7_9BACL